MDNQPRVPSGFENGNSNASHPSSSSQGAANPNMAHPSSFYQDPFIQQQQQQQYYYQYQQQHQPMMTPNSSYSAIHRPFPPPQFQHQYQYPTFPAPPPHYYPLATPPTSMEMNSSPYPVSLNSNPSSSMPHSRSSTTMLSSPSTNSNSNHSLHQFNPQPQPHLQFSTPINYSRTSSSLPSTSSFPIPPPPPSSASRASVDSDLASASSKSASINKQISMGQTGKGEGSNEGDIGTSSEKKKRRITSKTDTETLVALYNKNAYPDIGARELVALQTGMTPHSVAVWFANRRMTQRKLSARYAASGGQAAGGSIPPSPTPTGHSSESGHNKVIHLSSDNESVVDGGASLHPWSSTPLSEAAVRLGQGSASTSGSMASSASASAGKRKRGSEEQASPTFHLMPLSRQESRDEDVFSAPSSQPARPIVQLSKSSNVLTAAKPNSSSSVSTPAQAPAPVKVVPSVRSISGPLGAERRPTQPSARSLQKSFSTGTNFSLLVTPDGRASIGSLIPTKGDEENMPVKLDDPSGTSSSSAVLAAFAAQASLDETSTSSIVCKEQDLNQEQASHTATPLWKRMQSSNQSSSEGDSPLRDPRGARGEEEDEEITLRKVANRRAAKARAQQEAQAQLRLGTNGTAPSTLPLRSADARSVQSAVSFKRPLRHSASLDLAAAHDRSLKPLSETMKAPQFKAPSSSLWRPSTSRAISRTVSQPLTAAKRGRPRKGEYSSNPQAQVKAQSKKKVVAAKPSLAGVGKGKGKGKAAGGGLARSQSYTVANGRPSRSTYMALDSNAGPLPSKPGSNLNPRRSVSSTAPFNPRTSLDTFALAQSSHGRYRPSSSRESAARTASWSADNRTASWSASASSASNKNSQSIPPSSQSSSQLSDDWSNELISDSRSFIKSSEFPPSSQEKTTVNGDSQPKDDSGFFGSDDESEIDELELESNQSFRRLPTYQSEDKVNNPFRDSGRHPSTREDPEQQENDHHAAQLLLGLGSWA